MQDIKQKYKRVYVYSSGIYSNEEIKELFEPLQWIKVNKNTKLIKKGSIVVVWGKKPNTKKPVEEAQKAGVPVLYLEDGFLRSWDLGKLDSKTKSIVVDDKGIYYSALQESRLENLCNQGPISGEKKQRARKAIDKIIEYKLSKYNNSKPLPNELKNKIESEKGSKKVLIIGQVQGDMSLKFGACGYELEEIIKIAIKENPGSKIYYKVHPDVLLEKNTKDIVKSEDIELITESYNVIETLSMFDKIYTMTSQMGFEALLLNKEVVCMGVPFYSNWGLTDDRQKIKRRKQKLDIESLFYYAYIEYPIYLNGSIEDTIEELNDLKKSKKDIILYGISFWKRAFFNAYFKESEKLTYIESAKESLLEKMTFEGEVEVVIWGKKKSSYLEKYVKEKGFKITRVEDGFVRSVNLGIKKTTPSSLCFDKTGIYYDATQPSDLENLLNEYKVSENEIQRAQEMIEKITTNKISKYNDAPHLNFNTIYGKKSKDRVLVIGQVEGDMSLKYGCENKMTNNDLVRLAKKENPQAEIFYKIHPDVLGKEIDNPEEVSEICTIIDIPISADSVLETIDKVYTMTSLMGMEALLRKKEVVCMGAPFYSNWGLTDDRQKVNRRNKNRTIEELFAISYLVYPRYIDVHKHKFCTPEVALDNLIKDYKKIVEQGNKDETIFKRKSVIISYLSSIFNQIKYAIIR